MTTLLEISPSQLPEFLQRMKEWGFPTNTRLSPPQRQRHHGCCPRRHREIVVTSSAGTYYIYPDKDGTKNSPNCIITVKWEQFKSIMEWVKDDEDFETDGDGNVTVLRLSHFPDDEDDDYDDEDEDDRSQFRQIQLARLCRSFCGLDDQRLKVVDISRLDGLGSLRRTEVIRLSNLTELILPGHKTPLLVQEKPASSAFKMIDHHPILGNSDFDASKCEFHDRPGPSCAIIAKENGSSIWDGLSSLDICLASTNFNSESIGELINLTSLHVCCGDHHTSFPESWKQLKKLRTLEISSSELKCLPPTVIAAWSKTVQNLTIRIKQGGVDVREELNNLFSSWTMLEYVSFLHIPEDDDREDDAGEVDYLEGFTRRFPLLWSRNWNPPRLQVLVLCGIMVSFQDLPSSTLESLYLHQVGLHPSARCQTVEFPKMKKLSLDQFTPHPDFKVMVSLGRKMLTPALEKLYIGETCCPQCAFTVRDFVGLSEAERNQPKLAEFATSKDLQISTTSRRKIARLLALNRCRKKSGLDFTMSSPTRDDKGNDDWFGNEKKTPISLWPNALAKSRCLFRPGPWPHESPLCCCGEYDELDRMEKEFKEEDGIYLLLRLYFEMCRKRSINDGDDKKTRATWPN